MPEQKPKQREFSAEEKRVEQETMQRAESFCDKLFGERYRVSSVIGYGGMGYVLKAHDIQLNRTVAIKVLHQHFLNREKVIQRFVDEARTVASIKDKTNIVEVYDISREDTDERTGNWYEDEKGRRFPWFVMEYLPGESLDDIIESRQVFTPEGAYSYMAQVFDGLTVAHTHKIVHRDLKPDNIKVVDNRIPYTIKIMDFGISRTLAEGDKSTSGLTNLGEQFGTPHYMSPEQAEGDIAKIKATSDLYSAGVILFCMLTGDYPFDDDNYMNVMTMHMRDKPPLPSSINPEISPELDAVVLKAMAKEPIDRWQSASEFKAALRQAALGDQEPQPLTSKPPLELQDAIMDQDPGEEETIPANMIDIEDLKMPSAREAAPPDPVQVELPTVVAPEKPESKKEDPKSSFLMMVLLVSVALIVVGFLVWAVLAKRGSCAKETPEIAPAGPGLLVITPEEMGEFGKGVGEILAEEDDVESPTSFEDNPPTPLEGGFKATTAEDLKPYDQISWKGIQQYQGTKRCLKADATLDMLIKRYPSFPDPHFYRAKCYASHKKHRHKATHHYELFLEVAPGDHELVGAAEAALR